MAVQLMTPMLRRLIRVESKLHNLLMYMQVDKIDNGPPNHAQYDEQDMTRALVRIESKLQSLMLHTGLDPYSRGTDAKYK